MPEEERKEERKKGREKESEQRKKGEGYTNTWLDQSVVTAGRENIQRNTREIQSERQGGVETALQVTHSTAAC